VLQENPVHGVVKVVFMHSGFFTGHCGNASRASAALTAAFDSVALELV
jgi:hypothetical protein